MNLFPTTITPVTDKYRYDFPEKTRSRLLHTIRICLEKGDNQNISFASVIDEMQNKILQRYGGFRSSAYEAARMDADPVIEHFFRCREDEVMEFLRLCFETNWNCGGQPTVDAINQVLEEERIGYQLSPITQVPCKATGYLAMIAPNRQAYRTMPPTIIRRDEQRIHQNAVQPCLSALADARFANANAELLKAYEEFSKGDYGDAVTDAGSAFESVLKTICTHKNWTYGPTDTCERLLEVCRKNALFHPFYKQVLVGTATIRNKIGDAHGKGPKPEFTATKELADHMLNTVCTNINLVIALAKL